MKRSGEKKKFLCFYSRVSGYLFSIHLLQCQSDKKKKENFYFLFDHKSRCASVVYVMVVVVVWLVHELKSDNNA